MMRRGRRDGVASVDEEDEDEEDEDGDDEEDESDAEAKAHEAEVEDSSMLASCKAAVTSSTNDRFTFAPM